ncbi:hypothetical protein ACX80E_12510 [Arthrobacter sp. TMN-49]
MREWLWQHRMATIPLAIVLMALVSLLAYWASGFSWPAPLFLTLFNALLWAGLFCLYVRKARIRKRTLERQGIISYIRYPDSQLGSLQDRWAGGTATCKPYQITFQEVMSGTDISLGTPTTLDVVSVAGRPGPVTGGMRSYLPLGMKVMSLALTHGTVEIAAAPLDLAILEQQLLDDGHTT